jgi:hypothetical protein
MMGHIGFLHGHLVASTGVASQVILDGENQLLFRLLVQFRQLVALLLQASDATSTARFVIGGCESTRMMRWARRH